MTGLTRLSKGQSSFKNVKSAVTNLASTIGQLIEASTKPSDQENLAINDAVTIRDVKVPMTRNFTPKVYGCIVKIT